MRWSHYCYFMVTFRERTRSSQWTV